MWFRGGALRRGAELSSTMVGGAEQDKGGRSLLVQWWAKAHAQ